MSRRIEEIAHEALERDVVSRAELARTLVDRLDDLPELCPGRMPTQRRTLSSSVGDNEPDTTTAFGQGASSPLDPTPAPH